MGLVLMWKICSECKIPKLLSEFSKNKTHRDGHQSQYKRCVSEYYRDYNTTERGKAVRRAAKRRYNVSLKGKDAFAKYVASPKGRANITQYNNSPKRKIGRTVSVARHRARKKNAAICDFTVAQWKALQEHFDHRCAYCGRRAKGKLTQDHITPLSQGGNHTLSNIVPACSSCNSKKHTKKPLSEVQPILLLEVT
jgi:5-methylcytosine-specific restriction endonuclease McrA